METTGRLGSSVVRRMPASTADGSLRRLGPSLGLPPLPEADIALHRAPGITASAARLADHLVGALGAGLMAAVA